MTPSDNREGPDVPLTPPERILSYKPEAPDAREAEIRETWIKHGGLHGKDVPHLLHLLDAERATVATLREEAKHLHYYADDEDHGTERCMECFRLYSTVYRIPDELWRSIDRPPMAEGRGLLCPTCCDRLLRGQGVALYWEAARDEYPTARLRASQGRLLEALRHILLCDDTDQDWDRDRAQRAIAAASSAPPDDPFDPIDLTNAKPDSLDPKSARQLHDAASKVVDLSAGVDLFEEPPADDIPPVISHTAATAALTGGLESDDLGDDDAPADDLPRRIDEEGVDKLRGLLRPAGEG